MEQYIELKDISLEHEDPNIELCNESLKKLFLCRYFENKHKQISFEQEQLLETFLQHGLTEELKFRLHDSLPFYKKMFNRKPITEKTKDEFMTGEKGDLMAALCFHFITLGRTVEAKCELLVLLDELDKIENFFFKHYIIHRMIQFTNLQDCSDIEIFLTVLFETDKRVVIGLFSILHHFMNHYRIPYELCIEMEFIKPLLQAHTLTEDEQRTLFNNTAILVRLLGGYLVAFDSNKVIRDAFIAYFSQTIVLFCKNTSHAFGPSIANYGWNVI